MFGDSMSFDCFGKFLDQIKTGKKGTVVWTLVAMPDCFGGFVAMFFGGFLNQITNYNRKKKVQSSGHWLECHIKNMPHHCGAVCWPKQHSHG
jgi:hypothetical protein